MKIIIPMAGLGTRMRPHTLTVKKPLIPLAGKPIVQRLVENISQVIGYKIDEIAFVIGRFGNEVEEELASIARAVGARSSIYFQDEALGTGHAVWCASQSLSGQVVVAFADTLFYADFVLDPNADGTIWVQEVSNPQSFGVVTVDDNDTITGFVEKPKTLVSNLAIIGIYYFKDGERLQQQLQQLINENIRGNGEYQLTDALENMRSEGFRFKPGKVKEWLDCGNKEATVFTHARVLFNEQQKPMIHQTLSKTNTVIIQPCFIDEGVIIEDSVVGPYVSLGKNTIVKNSVVKNSIVQNNVIIENTLLTNSMIGNHAALKGSMNDLSVGDYNILQL